MGKKIRSGRGLVSILSECPNCGELVQNANPPGEFTFSLQPDLETTIEIMQGKVTKCETKATSGITSISFYGCNCGASWHIERVAKQRHTMEASNFRVEKKDG